MTTEDELFRIEEGFWLLGRDHFLQYLDDTCLLVFPQAGEMHGLFDRHHIAKTATSDNRWRDLAMTDRHVLPLGEVTIVSYRADVKRADGQPYAALVSSGYAERNGKPKLAFHQHSPI